jgi:hypothetical protein
MALLIQVEEDKQDCFFKTLRKHSWHDRVLSDFFMRIYYVNIRLLPRVFLSPALFCTMNCLDPLYPVAYCNCILKHSIATILLLAKWAHLVLCIILS